MPYSRQTTDRYNLCNISSAEIPKLDQSLVDWLASLDDSTLATHGIVRNEINQGEAYSRLVLGEYFRSQFQAITNELRQVGIAVIEHVNCEVDDLIDGPEAGIVTIKSAASESVDVERAIIATGHAFPNDDKPDFGYFASPWPMQKLLPQEDSVYDFVVGTLGASLSAFDVVASLSNRHGSYERDGNRLIFHPNANAPNFRIALHSANGWLPHLQYEQEEPFREIYRHATREQMLRLRDKAGGLSLDVYFDRICRPALIAAFTKDKRTDIVAKLTNPAFTLEEFVEQMTSEHEYDDPFSGMRAEMPEAERSIYRGKPIHWKETLDDLMFTLNFHFEWLYAEDVLAYHQAVVPFLMNVIAAMPLPSAQTLLALSDAGRLELVPGRVTIKATSHGETTIEIDNDGEVSERSYKMFIDCTGQGSVELGQFPFRSMIRAGTVVEAAVSFRDRESIKELDNSLRDKVISSAKDPKLRLDGIAIDGRYRVIGNDGSSNPRIFDIAFPHATGVRPYSYGLQACDTTAAIVVDALFSDLSLGAAIGE